MPSLKKLLLYPFYVKQTLLLKLSTSSENIYKINSAICYKVVASDPTLNYIC